jgi:protein-disulfide isomerase
MLFANQRGVNQGQFSNANLKGWASDLGLSPEPFNNCLDAAEDLPAIRDDLAVGRSAGVNVTPVFFVNGQRLVGYQRFETLSPVIDAKLIEAGYTP